MNVWSGAIALNGKSQLRGVQLVDRSSNWQSDISKESALDFRCFVNPAFIPLYARVGPSLEFHTTDTDTSRWLKHKLLGNLWLEDEDLDRFQAIQCPVGLLVSINRSAPKVAVWQTTDLLVHGVLSAAVSVERLPTPPESSSPELDDPVQHIVKQELRVYATPICAPLVTKAWALPTPQAPDVEEGHEQFAQFLPDLHSPSPKRKRVATLFESVAQHHKRVRQQGGEAVSQLMAHSLSQSSQQLQTLRIKREFEEPSLPILSRVASHRSRSLSIGSNLNPGKTLEHRPEYPRPGSDRSRARELTSKRETPVRLADFSARRERGGTPILASPDGKQESPEGPKEAETVIAENKNTITRTILTCMRVYGFNRTAPRLASSNKLLSTTNQHDIVPCTGEGKETQIAAPESLSLTTSATNSDEDEFKTMYHATYRASTFALRKYLKEPQIGKDRSRPIPPLLEKGKAMTYIDEFLKLFCQEED